MALSGRLRLGTLQVAERGLLGQWQPLHQRGILRATSQYQGPTEQALASPSPLGREIIFSFHFSYYVTAISGETIKPTFTCFTAHTSHQRPSLDF